MGNMGAGPQLLHSACPAPRGCGSFLLGLQASSASGLGGELVQPRGPQPAQDQDQVLLELGGGHSP